jgi:DNA-binding transcriptional ArsR family regulator
MGWIEDVLKEVPLSAVLKERVALADQKYEACLREVEALKKKVAALERENADLRARIPQRDEEAPLRKETERVLVHMFSAPEMDEREVGAMAEALGMERSVLQYHLDRLNEAGLAHMTGGDIDGVYWALKLKGRQYVVESNLHE